MHKPSYIHAHTKEKWNIQKEWEDVDRVKSGGDIIFNGYLEKWRDEVTSKKYLRMKIKNINIQVSTKL